MTSKLIDRISSYGTTTYLFNLLYRMISTSKHVRHIRKCGIPRESRQMSPERSM